MYIDQEVETSVPDNADDQEIEESISANANADDQEVEVFI